MKTKKTIVLYLIVCLITASIFFGFSKSNALAADEIKIGTIMPLSGPVSIVGMSWTRGFEMLVEDINTRGGVDINGKKYLLKLYKEDSKASSEAARTSALKLIHKDKVDFVLGGILEQVIEAIYGVCKDAGVLYGQANANLPGHPADVSPDKKLQVRLFISHDDTHAIDLDYLAKNYPDVKKIAIAAPDIGYNTMVDDFKKVAENKGMKVSYVEMWPFGITDFIPTYTKILASKPDAILAMVSGQAQYQLMAAKQLGFNGVFISNSPLAPEVFVAVAGAQDCDKLIVNGANMQDNTDKIKNVIKLWQNKYKEPFIGDSLLGYDALWILVQAIEKAQSIDATKVMAALDSMTHAGDVNTTHGAGRMGGMERFGCNRTLIRPIPITHFKKGKIIDSVFIMPDSL